MDHFRTTCKRRRKFGHFLNTKANESDRLEVRQFWNKKYERKQNEEHFFVIKKFYDTTKKFALIILTEIFRTNHNFSLIFLKYGTIYSTCTLYSVYRYLMSRVQYFTFNLSSFLLRGDMYYKKNCRGKHYEDVHAQNVHKIVLFISYCT